MSKPEIIVPGRITREFIQQHQELNFVYSVNVFGGSVWGQAFEAANEPNTYGVPVCFRFCRSNNNSYFFDTQYDSMLHSLIDAAIASIPKDKPIIVFPKIGQGFSRMKEFAPITHKYLMEQLRRIEYPNIIRTYA